MVTHTATDSKFTYSELDKKKPAVTCTILYNQMSFKVTYYYIVFNISGRTLSVLDFKS